MLRLYMLLYLLSLFIIALIIIPTVFHFSYNNAVNTTTDITSSVEEMQSQMKAATLNLVYSDVVENKLFSNAYSSESLKKSVIELALDSFIDRNPDILAIQLVTGDGSTYYPIFSYKYDLPALLKDNPYHQTLLSKNNSSYYGPLITDVFDKVGMKYNAFSYGVTNSHGSNKFTATIFYNANSYLKIIDRLLSRTMDSCTIIDRNGSVIFSTSDAAAQALVDSPELYNTHVTGTSFTGRGVFFYSMATSSGWRVICYASYFTLAANALLVLLSIAVLSLIAPLAYYKLLNRTVAQELTPIKELSSIMSSFHIGQDVKTDIHTGDEIEDMCVAFNSMVATINRQAVEIREQEKQNAMVLYKLLVTQIDPHFIYNTMNVINIMARNDECESIIEINSALIKILRERLSVKLSTLHTLEEEIDTLEQYNLIMRYRFSDHINTYISVAPELLQVMIPKNILQPLVENALYHGYDVENADRPLDVDIMIYSQGDDLVIEISDNGKGMSPEQLKLIQENSTNLYKDEKPHIGIDNIRQRIAFLYGERASMEVSSELNVGTNIVITIPMQVEPLL